LEKEQSVIFEKLKVIWVHFWRRRSELKFSGRVATRLAKGGWGAVILRASTLVAGPHQSTYWADNKAGAVSITFDDGIMSQYTQAVPALNARGFKGTFFVITGRIDSDTVHDFATWDEWRNAANQGHEIGSHTKTHPHLPQLSLAQMQDEIGGAKAAIDAQITTQKCLTFSYPFGELNDNAELIAQAYYIAARGTSCDLNNTPYDLYDMKACEDTLSVEQMKAKADEAEQQGKWLISFHHSLDGTMYGYWTIGMLTDYLGYLKTKNLWVDTFGSVTKYIKERASADLSLVSSSDEQIVLSLTDTLDNAIYDEPLTIRSEVPSSWANVNVQQGSGAITVTSVVEDTKTVIYYNVIPDRGFITLKKVTTLQPTVTGLSPSYATVGGSSFTLTVNGSNFVSGATVRWNGSSRLTTFASGSQLTATITASDISVAGTASVTVYNPSGDISNAMTFEIRNPTPTVATPTITPPGGTYTNSVDVALATQTAGASIRYTTDGTEPTSSSTLYSASIMVTQSITLRAKAFLSGYNDSATASASFTINPASGGSSLSVQMAQSSTSVTLSAEGTSDWAHWGLTNASSFNHKSGVTQQISNYTLLGSTNPGRFTDSRVAYSWSGGTPTASATNSTTGIFFTGIGNGYQLSIPAQSSQSVLKLYLGLWTARGRFEAKLSDGSVPSYVAYLDNAAGSVDRVVTLSFSAASSGVNLIIGYTVENNYGNSWGNITLQAATLVRAQVNQAPDGVINSPATNVSITVGQSVSFAGTGTDPDNNLPLTYRWGFGTGSGIPDSTAKDPGPVQFNAAGTYAVTFTVTDSQGLADPTPAMRTVVVSGNSGNQPADGTISSPLGNVTINVGDSVYFTGEGTDPENDLPLTYLWTFGAGSGVPASSRKDPGLIQFNNPGMYTVVLTVTDGLGQADPTPATLTVTVVTPAAAVISQANWSVKFADSQELAGEDGSAVNAIDGNPSTIWHTDWYVYSPLPPHELQIDLGGLYRISGFRYLPRQDGIKDGWVTQYEVFVSTDGVNWESPVATGTFAGDATEKQVTFAPALGQFVRFSSMSNDAKGMPWASAAEIRVVGVPVKPSLRIVKPLNYHLQTGTDLLVRANASLNDTAHSGWGVRFLLDGGPSNGGQAFDVHSAPFETTFTALSKAEHVVDAVLIDSLGKEVSTSDTRDQSIQVGIGNFYVAMGDSITAAYPTGDGDNFPDDDTSLDGRNTGGGYVPILNNLLTAGQRTPYTIVNHGFGGTTSAYGVSLIPVLLNKYPDSQRYLILYGMNDSRPWLPVPSGKGLSPGDPGYPGSFKDNMQRMVDAVKGAGKAPTLAEINIALGDCNSPVDCPPYPNPDAGARSVLIKEYNLVIDQLVGNPANNITVQPPDFYTYFRQHYATEYFDNIHPNGVGYQSMGRLWCEAITGATCGGQ
jgi:peptidoglycan/xylan/chitin deacetylase (PgdA/CDA1 family)/lysophospholipase L1-like esterase